MDCLYKRNVLYKNNFEIEIHANSPSEESIRTFQEALVDVLQNTVNFVTEGK